MASGGIQEASGPLCIPEHPCGKHWPLLCSWANSLGKGSLPTTTPPPPWWSGKDWGCPSPALCAQVAAGARWPQTSLIAATWSATFRGAAHTPSGLRASARRAWAPTAAPQSRSSWEGPATWVSLCRAWWVAVVLPELPCHFTKTYTHWGGLFRSKELEAKCGFKEGHLVGVPGKG